MNLRKAAKTIPLLVESVRAFRSYSAAVLRSARQMRHAMRRGTLVEHYLARHSVAKLQIGSGKNNLPGWLNTDFMPTCPSQVLLDATRTFPLPDESFSCVFTEHMIEHVPYEAGLAMLKECYRVLKPGGRLRVSRPSLENIVALYRSDKSDIQKRYLEWAIEENDLPRFPAAECFVVNNFLRAWGHQFIYDMRTLASAMESVGFRNVRRWEPGESDDGNLCGIESHGKVIGYDRNLIETMVLEGTRGDHSYSHSGATEPTSKAQASDGQQYRWSTGVRS